MPSSAIGTVYIPFRQNVDDLFTQDHRRIVQDVRWLDIMLGYGQLSIVKDFQESKKRGREASLGESAERSES